MSEVINIYACNKGHRYRTSLRQPGQETTCPRCDRLALVALAYGDCQRPPKGCRLLSFRTEAISDTQDLAETLSLIGSYNAFRPGLVEAELRPFFPRLSGIEIGREGSPVLYAHLPYWTHQAIGWQGFGMGVRIPDEERSALGQAVLKAMERAHADELSDNGHTLRAWWD